MRSFGLIGSFAALAVSAPLAAQSNRFRTDEVLSSATSTQNQRGRTADKIPSGQLPPAGMCRIWIDGVPPGHQPAPTDCQTAVATKPANARILWGDQTAFPGKGKMKSQRAGLQTGQSTTVGGNGRSRGSDVENDNDADDRDASNGNSARSNQLPVMNGGAVNASRGKSLKSKNGKGHGED
jgi:hypothetical protein